MMFDKLLNTIFGPACLGLRLEGALGLICLIFGTGIFIDPSLALDSKATVDLYWQGHGRIISFPFLLAGWVITFGLLSNRFEWKSSKVLRCAGALIASFIWSGMIWKFMEFGSPFSFGAVCSLVFLLMCIGTIGSALADLPQPGFPKE